MNTVELHSAISELFPKAIGRGPAAIEAAIEVGKLLRELKVRVMKFAAEVETHHPGMTKNHRTGFIAMADFEHVIRDADKQPATWTAAVRIIAAWKAENGLKGKRQPGATSSRQQGSTDETRRAREQARKAREEARKAQEEARKAEEEARRQQEQRRRRQRQARDSGKYGDPWEVLGLERGADQAAIKKAYRTLAQKHHPDKGGSEAEFIKVQKAWEALRARA